MVSVYVHIPFCQSRCHYCDFATWAGRENLMEPYGASVLAELRLLQRWLEEDGVDTLYIGGGTPSLFSVDALDEMVETVPLNPQAEVTIEANPGTLSAGLLVQMREAGINRLSVGMQSAHQEELRILGRTHEPDAVRRAIEWARAGGFRNVSLDLIYGIPGQTLGNWGQTLATAIDLQPEHLSLYALTVEPGTRLARWITSGKLPTPDPDEAAEMYALAQEQLQMAGYAHYEISNWAQPGFEARHNLAYWRNDAYVGVGASAWGHWPQVAGSSWRLRNVRDPEAYIRWLNRGRELVTQYLPVSPACVEQEFIPRPWAMAETMFMGLRLAQEGVSRAAFSARFGLDPVEQYGAKLTELERQGRIELGDDAIRLDEKSLLVSNEILTAFLPS